MAEPELLETRVISGKGLIRFDSLSDRKYREYNLYIDVIRRPKNEYLNFRFSSPKSYYATVQFRKDKYITEVRTIEYQSELWRFIPDISGQNLFAIKCAYEGTLQSFANLATGLGLTVISVVDLIKDYKSLVLPFNEFAVTCYSNSGIRFRLYGTPYEVCDPLKNQQQPPPPTPPAEPGSIPPDAPLNTSPSYDGDGDDGDTQPFDGDIEGNGTEECLVYNVPFSLSYSDGIGRVPVATFTTVFGEVGEYRVDSSNPTSWALLLECRGLRNSEADVCGEFQEYPIFEGGTDYLDIEVGAPTLVE